jgi:hypothetical protein
LLDYLLNCVYGGHVFFSKNVFKNDKTMNLTIIFKDITDEEAKRINDTLDELEIDHRAIPDMPIKYHEEEVKADEKKQ